MTSIIVLGASTQTKMDTDTFANKKDINDLLDILRVLDLKDFKSAVRNHLIRCELCHEYYQGRLFEELVNRLKEKQEKSKLEKKGESNVGLAAVEGIALVAAVLRDSLRICLDCESGKI